MKGVTIFLILFGFSAAIGAQTNEHQEKTNYIPLFGYEYLSLGRQSVHAPTGGLAVQSDDTDIFGLYGQHNFSDDFEKESPKKYHSIDVFHTTKKDRHQFLSVFKSSSDQPVIGGLSTYQIAALYGYEWIRTGSFSLSAGGGLAAGDFGINLPDGSVLPVIPLPLIRMQYSSQLVNMSLDFITGPNFSATVGPESSIRLITDLRIDRLRDERDLIFDCSLAYRFFHADHEYGDIAGISAGIKSDEYNFDNHNGNSTGIQYYAAYGTVDITLLQLSAGYTFAGIERHNEEKPLSLGDGFFVTLQALYQF